MHNTIETLEPQMMWTQFVALNKVPRPSKKEEKVIEMVVAFGAQLGLETKVDAVGNVIIKKPASKGMENRTRVVLQSHLDMVHQKNADTVFDFEREGIQMYIDGDWVTAKGTTLGADNGIGVASIMAVLASKNIEHPAIEALFTIDEETGMTGALGLEAGWLEGEILLNLDTEEDTELTIGCAGGVDVTAEGHYKSEEAEGLKFYKVEVKGLTGGHSGMDIVLGRGNANKIMNRILYELNSAQTIRIAGIDGGGLRNAIPRESKAVVGWTDKEHAGILERLEIVKKEISKEYASTDPKLTIECMPHGYEGEVMEAKFQTLLLQVLYAVKTGIQRMSPEIDGLVQTSNNLARVLVEGGSYSIQCLSRSSVESEKHNLTNQLRATFEILEGCSVRLSGDYPGWEPKPNAEIIGVMTQLYQTLFQDTPHVTACHAGLECGILGANYPTMEMISFGPNIKGAHSPDEAVQISSVQKYWLLLMETLKNIPIKK